MRFRCYFCNTRAKVDIQRRHGDLQMYHAFAFNSALKSAGPLIAFHSS